MSQETQQEGSTSCSPLRRRLDLAGVALAYLTLVIHIPVGLDSSAWLRGLHHAPKSQTVR